MGLIMRDSVPYAGSNDIVLTQAQYDALVQAGEVLPNVNYYISNANHSTPIYASGVHYDNSDSGLDADDVQEAIDELVDKLVVTSGICQRDTTNTSSGDIGWSRTGNVVAVGGYVKTSNSTSGAKLFTLPYKPISRGNPLAQHDDSPYCVYLNLVVGSLDVTVGPHSTGYYIRFAFSYITSD